MGGATALRSRIARDLWPDSTERQARDNLRKHLRVLTAWSLNGFRLPIFSTPETVRLDMREIQSDADEFMRLCERGQPDGLRKAERLYAGRLLEDNGFAWALDFEGAYDVEYMELLDRLAAHYKAAGKKNPAAFYERKLSEYE